MESQLDVVIVSWAGDDEFRALTDSAIRTCRASSRDVRFDVLVVETNPEAPPYADAATLYYPGEKFNYSRALNLGVERLSGRYVACCNNDLVFGDHWAEQILRTMARFRLRSACPLCPTSGSHAPYCGQQGVRFGYGIGHELAGWCIVLERSLWNEIGRFDEVCDFWYSDNVYALQLQRAGVWHGLVLDSTVTHLGSRTLLRCEEEAHRQMTADQRAKFEAYALTRKSPLPA
jgi:hypothetical protein